MVRNICFYLLSITLAYIAGCSSDSKRQGQEQEQTVAPQKHSPNAVITSLQPESTYQLWQQDQKDASVEIRFTRNTYVYVVERNGSQIKHLAEHQKTPDKATLQPLLISLKNFQYDTDWFIVISNAVIREKELIAHKIFDHPKQNIKIHGLALWRIYTVRYKNKTAFSKPQLLATTQIQHSPFSLAIERKKTTHITHDLLEFSLQAHKNISLAIFLCRIHKKKLQQHVQVFPGKEISQSLTIQANENYRFSTLIDKSFLTQTGEKVVYGFLSDAPLTVNALDSWLQTNARDPSPVLFDLDDDFIPQEHDPIDISPVRISITNQ